MSQEITVMSKLTIKETMAEIQKLTDQLNTLWNITANGGMIELSPEDNRELGSLISDSGNLLDYIIETNGKVVK